MFEPVRYPAGDERAGQAVEEMVSCARCGRREFLQRTIRRTPAPGALAVCEVQRVPEFCPSCERRDLGSLARREQAR